MGFFPRAHHRLQRHHHQSDQSQHHIENAHESHYEYKLAQLELLIKSSSEEFPPFYSMLSGSLVLFSTEYLFMYSCLLPLNLQAFLRDNEICWDIALQMLISGVSGTSPVLIKSASLDPRNECPLFYFDTKKPRNPSFIPLSTWISLKSNCINQLIPYFGNRNVLRTTKTFVDVFDKIPFRKKDPSEWK